MLVRSSLFIDNAYKLLEYLYQMATGKNRVESNQSGERERERESRLMEWETECRTEIEIAWN
jgi:hypothetical protein